jgi:hypothetical protein
VVRAERSLDAVMIEETPRVPRILRNNKRGRGKNLDRAM